MKGKRNKNGDVADKANKHSGALGLAVSLSESESWPQDSTLSGERTAAECLQSDSLSKPTLHSTGQTQNFIDCAKCQGSGQPQVHDQRRSSLSRKGLPIGLLGNRHFDSSVIVFTKARRKPREREVQISTRKSPYIHELWG